MPAKPEPTPLGATVRVVVAAVVVVLAAALGALILGEYEFEGAMPYVTGILFGLVLGEIAVGVGRRKSVLLGVVTGAAGAAGLVWAAWISTGEGLRPLPWVVWPAALLAVVAGGTRAGGVKWGSLLRSRRG